MSKPVVVESPSIGFFLVRDKKAIDLGVSWPDTAVVGVDNNRYAIVEERPDGTEEASVLHGVTPWEALAQAEKIAKANIGATARVGTLKACSELFRYGNPLRHIGARLVNSVPRRALCQLSIFI